MQNENDLIEFANDLRDQYHEMQQNYEKKIALLEQKIQSMSAAKLKFYHEQFESPRPFADAPVYTSAGWRLFNNRSFHT